MSNNTDTTMHPLALRYGRYTLARELSTAQVRDLPNFDEIYDKVNAEWIASGPKRPKFGDGLDEKLALKQFYEEIDKICFEEDERTPEQHMAVIHASSCGTMSMQENELSPRHMGLEAMCRMMRQGSEWAMERIFNPEAHPEIPGLRVKVESIPAADDRSLDRIVESLLDKPFTYRRPDGTPAECTIVDFGSSRRFASGKYYLVSHGDDEVVYTEDDVKSILENRVE